MPDANRRRSDVGIHIPSLHTSEKDKPSLNTLSHDHNHHQNTREAKRVESHERHHSSLHESYRESYSPGNDDYMSPEEAIREKFKKKALQIERHLHAKLRKEDIYDAKIQDLSESLQKKSEKLNRTFDEKRKARENKVSSACD